MGVLRKEVVKDTREEVVIVPVIVFCQECRHPVYNLRQIQSMDGTVHGNFCNAGCAGIWARKHKLRLSNARR